MNCIQSSFSLSVLRTGQSGFTPSVWGDVVVTLVWIFVLAFSNTIHGTSVTCPTDSHSYPVPSPHSYFRHSVLTHRTTSLSRPWNTVVHTVYLLYSCVSEFLQPTTSGNNRFLSQTQTPLAALWPTAPDYAPDTSRGAHGTWSKGRGAPTDGRTEAIAVHTCVSGGPRVGEGTPKHCRYQGEGMRLRTLVVLLVTRCQRDVVSVEHRKLSLGGREEGSNGLSDTTVEIQWG